MELIYNILEQQPTKKLKQDSQDRVVPQDTFQNYLVVVGVKFLSEGNFIFPLFFFPPNSIQS